MTALTLGLGASVAFNLSGIGGVGARVRAATKTSKATKTTTRTSKPASTKSTVVPTAVPGSSTAPPNIVFALADDMGVDSSPCYPAFGVVKPRMPNVEQLCNDGVVFDNMTASPVCSPSRAAALTGKYAFRTKVGNVDDELSADEPTVFDVVANAPTPYANAVIGKWHLGGAQPDPTQPQRLGVEYFDGFLRGAVPDYSNWPRVTQGQTSTSSTYTTTAFTDSAIAWTAKQTKPWLLWMAYNAPHTPFHLPPSTLLSNSTLSGAADDIRQNPRGYYLASLEALDAELGRLLRSLPAATRANTVVMFMGDNGTPARAIQAPFSAGTSKGTVSEGGVHVPLVVAGAGVSERGKRSSALLNGVDVFPTIAELARTKSAGPIDGVSFVGQLTNAVGPGSRAFAYAELFTGTTAASENVWAVRDARYKLVHDVTSGGEQFFDVQIRLFLRAIAEHVESHRITAQLVDEIEDDTMCRPRTDDIREPKYPRAPQV